ncbi:MAG: helix-turn-helix domain-containing protein, partial [Pseudoflavonifractor sp.]
ISATNVDLQDAITRSQFREDFFYRVSTIVINIPPLRKRREDLPILIRFFTERASAENGLKITGMDPAVKKFLYEYDYPGNLRELKNIIERMVVFSSGGKFTLDGLPVMYAYHKGDNRTERDTTFREVVPFQTYKRSAEKTYLTWVLSHVGGNVAEAARQLDMSPRQLFNKIKDLDIKK